MLECLRVQVISPSFSVFTYSLDDLIQAYRIKSINILTTLNFISMPWTSQDSYQTPLRYLIGTYNFTGPLLNSQFFLYIKFPFDFPIPDSSMDLDKSLRISVTLFSIYKLSLIIIFPLPTHRSIIGIK